MILFESIHSLQLADAGPEMELMGEAGPQFSDVRQGVVGDCYFLAGLAATACTRPGLIQKLFAKTGERSDSGRLLYQLRLYLGGRAVEVAVDDMVPIRRGSRKLFAASPSPTKKFWPVIVEKALAKLFGTYRRIESGWTFEAFKAISQAPIRRVFFMHLFGKFFWDDKLIGFGRWSHSSLWRVLQKAQNSAWPMVADGWVNSQRHTFAVLELGAKTVKGESVRAIRLFNTNGENHYAGAIEGQPKDRGDYWVTFDEFTRDFESISYAEMESDVQVVSRSVAPGLALFNVTTQSARPFSVHLEWPSNRLYDDACKGEVSTRMAVVPAERLLTASAKKARGVNVATFREVRVSQGPGEYLVFVGAGFGRLSSVVEEVTLAVHAREDDNVTLTQVDTGSFTSLCFRALGLKCLQLLIAARQQKQATETMAPQKKSDSKSGRCAREAKHALDRLKRLNNVMQLRQGAEDSEFPPGWPSIATHNGYERMWKDSVTWESLSRIQTATVGRPSWLD